jgi:hypothetical protein
MKTKDFIKMLQDADPSGEAHIRIPEISGAVWFPQRIEGFYNGPYFYVEKLDPDGEDSFNNLKIIASTNGNKVDINLYDYETLVWDQKGNIDEIKKRIGFNFSDRIYPESLEKGIWYMINKYIEEYKSFRNKNNNDE